jgi:ubiquinone/menaquinone biosynthesis C-methylase UbiE
MRIDQYRIMYEVEDTHFWYQGMRQITKTLLEKYLPKKTNNKILDAGCGTGANMLFLKKYGDVYGFDISNEALKFCKKRGLKNIKRASIEKIPFESNYFDLITCFDVLYHKKVKNYNNVLNEFNRVLKSHGLLIIRVPAFQFLLSRHDVIVHTRTRFNKKQLENYFVLNKFKVLKISYINFFLFPFIFIKRKIDNSFISNKSTNTNSDLKKLPRIINFLLKTLLIIEGFLIKFINMPFGSSLIVVGKK